MPSKRKKIQQVEDALDGLKEYVCSLSSYTTRIVKAKSLEEARELAKKPYRGIVWEVDKVEVYEEWRN
jgi:hypothetical protein